MTAPEPGDPTREEWRELYAAADEYRALAPWDWMFDADVFGVQDPASGEIGWCSVFGAAGQVFGLMVYAGTAGLAVHRATADGQIGVDDAGYLQHGWLASFEDRGELDREDLATIKDLALRYRGRHAWPRFRSYVPGCLPWRLTGAEARFLAVALREAVTVARRLRDGTETAGPDDAGRYLVRVPGLPGAPWEDRRLAPAPAAPDALPPIDELRVRRLRERLRRESATWECDYYHSPAIIDDGAQRPYFASLFLVVDGRSGLVLTMEMGAPPLDPAFLQQQFLGALEGLGLIPGTVAVKREPVRAALAPLAAGLDLTLRAVPALPALDRATAALAAHLRRR